MMIEPDVPIQHNHPGVLAQIKVALHSLHKTSVWLDLASSCGVMIGIITTNAPALFEISVNRKVQGNYIWDHFQCRESFVKRFLREQMRWSLRRATHPGKKMPENITQVLTDAALRLVSTISEHKVPESLSANSEEHQPHI